MKKPGLLILLAMLIIPVSGSGQGGLIISEIADPADDFSGRFVELYNAGAVAIDFDTELFFLSRQSNGGTNWGEVQLSGSVEPGGTYVIGGTAFADLYGFAPDLTSGILTGNGDDAYYLYMGGDHTAGVLYDIYGESDTDGTGTAWEYEDSRAYRQPEITSPNTTWTAAEWVIETANMADCDPGTHNDSGTTEPDPGDFTISIINDTVVAGSPAEVHIAVSELTLADDIISYQFDLSYNPLLLEYTGQNITGTLAEGGTIEVNNQIAGSLSVSYMSADPLIGTGNLVVLEFNTLAQDTAEIVISDAWLNSTPVSNLVNGSVVIMDPVPPVAAVTYNDDDIRFADTLLITATFSKPMNEADPVILNLTGAVTIPDLAMERQNDTLYTYSFPVPTSDGMVSLSFSNGTDQWGNVLDPLPVSGESFLIVEFRPGDVDDDGNILAYDAALTLQHSVGMDPLPEVDPLPWEYWRDSTANVDGTGGITAFDAALILQYSAGIITGFDMGEKKSAPVADVFVEIVNDEIVFSSSGELLGLNLRAIDEDELLAAPVLLSKSFTAPAEPGFITAVNSIQGEVRVGMCSAYAPPEGTALLKFPCDGEGSVTFEMLINGRKKGAVVDLLLGTIQQEPEEFLVYPNPAGDFVRIDIPGNGRIKEARMRIYTQAGALVMESVLPGPSHEISLSPKITPGVYILELTGERGQLPVRKKLIIQ